jgi:hypothetical protein
MCRASREGAKAWLRTPGANDDEDVLAPLGAPRMPRVAGSVIWPADADVRTWRGGTFGGEEHGAAAAGRVVEIDLRGKHLTGSVPATLGQLAALEVLRLQNNRLTGEVPPALLAALEELSLYNNRLTSVQQLRDRFTSRTRGLGRGRRPSRLAVSCHYDERVIYECEDVESLSVCT